MHPHQTHNNNNQNNVNNVARTEEHSRVIDSNKGQNIPNEMNSTVSNPPEDLKYHRGFREDMSGQKENQPTTEQLKSVRTSNNASAIGEQSRIANMNSTSIIYRQSSVDHQVTTSINPHGEVIQTNNATVLLNSPSASNASSYSRKEEDIQTKRVGFQKESSRPPKVSGASAQLETVNEYDHKESTQVYKSTVVQASVLPVLPSKMQRTSTLTVQTELRKVNEPAYKESIKSQKETYLPSNIRLVVPKKPGNTLEPQQSTVAIAEMNTTIIEKAQNPAEERCHSKLKKVETDCTDCTISEQTLYVRAIKKLSGGNPFSITNLDDYLKKSKVDFEHFYYKKPISNVKITDFTLMKTLGVGAFGKVVLGELKTDKTLYAIKVIDKVGVVKRNHVRYVSNEKRILQSLNFPFVIHLKYFFSDFHYLYFAMPYIPGGNFYRHLKIYRKLNESDARFYIGQLVMALEYLHYLELIHRDIKTENVMIDAFGYLKLVDFGQCIRCYSTDKTWTFTGTPDYMAPEIILGKGYDCAVDWWALGIITFEICAGFRPFKEENSRKLQLLILCNQYSIPSSFSRSLKKLIESLLVLEPKKRIANYSKKASMIKKHIWFKGLDWLALLNRSIEAPFIPNLQKSSQNTTVQQKDPVK